MRVRLFSTLFLGACICRILSVPSSVALEVNASSLRTSGVGARRNYHAYDPPHLRGSLVRTRAHPLRADADRIRGALLQWLSVGMVLALTFQSIPLPIPAQISPLTSLLALGALPLLLISQQQFAWTPLAKVVVGFVAFLVLHSLVAVFLDVVIWQEKMVRLLAWARQIVALAAGFSVFWVLRTTLCTIPDRKLAALIVWGSIPPILVALLNVVWGLFGSEAARALVIGVRGFLAPNGYNYPYRASGLSLEPSHFVWYLCGAGLSSALGRC